MTMNFSNITLIRSLSQTQLPDPMRSGTLTQFSFTIAKLLMPLIALLLKSKYMSSDDWYKLKYLRI
ncbi:unnamed protein product, partial [Hymenolepis diminuta]